MFKVVNRSPDQVGTHRESPSLGKVGLLGWRMFVVKVTDVITRPSRDKCDRGAMWETRHLSLLGKFPVFISCFQHFPSVQMS